MTASVIYARGGGHGHAMRGAELQRRLRARGERTLLLVTPESARFLDPSEVSFDTELPHGYERIIVDTFPRGWRNELDAQALARFDERVLVARYNRDPDYDIDAYDRVLSPYPAELDEWPALRRAENTGWLVRPTPIRIEPGDDLVVLDPGERMPASLMSGLAAFARRLGMSLVRHVRTPEHVRCRKLLSIGAGYNSVYELATTHVDVRFVPLARRYDDQARRAALVGRSCATLESLLEWLRTPVTTQPFAPTVGRA